MDNNGKRWTEEEINLLRENPSTPIKELSTLLKRHPEAVRGKFKQLKIRRTEKKFNKYSQEEIEFITANYQSLNNQELAIRLCRDEQSIKGCLQTRKLKRAVEDHCPFFDIDIHPHYAYILGWLFADGYVTNKHRRCCLLIEESDANYLKPFMFGIYPHWRIYRRTKAGRGPAKIRPQITFMCRRKSVASFLISAWNLDKKSYYMSDSFYNYICSGGEECKKCFLRGFFDGDGCITPSHPQSTLQVCIAKRADFNWSGIKNLMPNDIKTKHSIKHSALGSCSILSICTTDDAAKFCKYIYDTNFKAALPRKKDRAVAHFKRPKYKKKYGELEQ